jgi:hypothetical protein
MVAICTICCYIKELDMLSQFIYGFRVIIS